MLHEKEPLYRIRLDELVARAQDDLAVNKRTRRALADYLAIVQNRDEQTYLHSQRVGLLCKDIAHYLLLEEKPIFYAGKLHDLGKSLIEGDLLRKTEPFTKKDFEQMRKHVEYGHAMLEGIMEFTAQIIVRHHLYQQHPYPEVIPASKVTFPKQTRKRIERYARLLSIADSYDVITTRDNARSTHIDPSDREKIKERFRHNKPDDFALIEELVDMCALDNRKYLQTSMS